MEQIHRAQRYLDRIKAIYVGCPHRYDRVEFYEDDVVSFFIHCHHISDWLLANNPTRITRLEINNYINSHVELQICADFCNGKKHCVVSRTRSGASPKMGKRRWFILTYKKEINKPVTFISTYEIVHIGVTYDALALAEKCMGLWRAKIREIALSVI